MKRTNEFSTVEEYINAQSEQTQIALRELRKCILKAAPEAIETFNYQIPAYALVKGGKRDKQIMMAGYDKHVGFYPTPSVISKFEEDLAGYKMGKGSVQFPLDEPLPKDLIVQMVQYRMMLLGLY